MKRKKARILGLSKIRHRCSNRAVSETIATIVLIAVAVVLGSVAYVWASSTSVRSENNLGQVAQTDIHAVSERFEIIATNFTTTTSVSIWLFNSGIYNTSITSVILNYTSTPITCTLTGWALPKGQLESYSLSTASCSPASSFAAGSLQTIKAVGQYGFYATYQVQA